MIQICFKSDSLEILGHAEFAPSPHDVVCAGISAIVLGAWEL